MMNRQEFYAVITEEIYSVWETQYPEKMLKALHNVVQDIKVSEFADACKKAVLESPRMPTIATILKFCAPACQRETDRKRQERSKALSVGPQCPLCHNTATVFTWSRDPAHRGAEFAFRCPDENCRALKILNPAYPVWDDERHGMKFYMRSWMGDSGTHSNRPAFETDRPTGQLAKPERVREVFAHLRKTLGLDVVKEAAQAEAMERQELTASQEIGYDF